MKSSARVQKEPLINGASIIQSGKVIMPCIILRALRVSFSYYPYNYSGHNFAELFASAVALSPRPPPVAA